MKDCQLVMIEWEDSAQPLPNWSDLADFVADRAVLCTSVGWLIHDGEDVKAVAPNMGGLRTESSVQVSGVIRIPARCVVKVTMLDEPAIAISRPAPCPVPSSHPEREPMRQGS